ncbi:PTS sugar transporter subunit IIA [Amphibacillus sp. Q70]|uniref:PTS sugar transporter subunit IIA n=1 Tax=Amphibacillus sp. Q70 TaxID=3453416 RepID=UPI003F859159
MEEESILNQKNVKFKLKAKTKDEAIHELANLLLYGGYLSDVDRFIEDVFIREGEGVTGIGNGIAIPHGKSQAVKKIGLAIGKTDYPIDWESLDGSKVQIIFLFAVSNTTEGAHDHIRLLSKIATKLGNENNIRALNNASKFEDLKAIFD